MSPAVVAFACLALHASAATAALERLLPELDRALESSASGTAFVLRHGLERFLLVELYLPPVTPLVVGLGVLVASGARRRLDAFQRWFVAGIAVQTIESLARVATVLLSPPTHHAGDVLELPSRFSSGLLPILDALGRSPPPALRYWLAVATLASAVTVHCWARALSAADPDHRRRDDDGLSVAWVVVATAYVATALVVQVLTPLAVRLFLGWFG